jgi:hypothetical protein
MAGIKLYIGLDSRGLKKGLSDNGRLISRWANRMVSRLASAGMRMGRAITRGMITSIKRLGFVAGGLIAGGIVKSVKEAARFEDYGVQFEALLGSVDAAKKRMDEIKQVDLNVPFDITSIADASRILQVFTNGAFASTEALTMMADAASVTPNNIKEVAFWYGRAYSMIQSGRKFGEAAMRLQEMGLISGDARNEMERLGQTKGPQRTAQIMKVLNGEMLKFAGAAAKRAKTFNGIWSIFTSATKQAFASVGDAILPLAKDWLVELIAKINKLRDNGTLASWGATASRSLENLRASIEKNVLPVINRLMKSFRGGTLKDDLAKELGSISESIGDIIGGLYSKYASTAVQVGVDIGVEIAKGIGQGLDKHLGDNFFWWLSKQPGNLMNKSADVVEAWDSANAGKKNNRMKDVDFGRKIITAQGKNLNPKLSPQWANDMWARQMASKAYSNPEWAKQLFLKPLPVEIANKKEETP